MPRAASVPVAHIDADRLDHELAIRELTSERFAALVGISPMTLSRARKGDRIRTSIIRRMGEVFSMTPPTLAPSTLALLAQPNKSNAAEDKAAASKEAGDGTAAAPTRG